MSDHAHKWKLLLNYACICTVWGSTFLAIKIAIQEIPPFVVTSVRYLFASAVLLIISRLQKEEHLTGPSLRFAAVSGILLTTGNALVCYSETELPTGLVAVVIGSLPAWIMMLNWQFFRGPAPHIVQVMGIALALVGVAALSGSQFPSLGTTTLGIWLALFASIVVWALGTLTQRQSQQKRSVFGFSAVQSAVGGIVFSMYSAARGDFSFEFSQISWLPILSVVYLALAGTVAASTSYVWLSQNADPRFVSTYALVTPLVAVWLGWLFANEIVRPSMRFNTLLVIGGVALIVRGGSARPRTDDAGATLTSQLERGGRDISTSLEKVS